MAAAAFAAIAPLQVINLRKNHQTILVEIKILRSQFRQRLLFRFRGLAHGQLLYLAFFD